MLARILKQDHLDRGIFQNTAKRVTAPVCGIRKTAEDVDMKLDVDQICDRLATMISGASKIIPLGPHSPKGGQTVIKFAADNRKPSIIDMFQSNSMRPVPVRVERKKSRDFPY